MISFVLFPKPQSQVWIIGMFSLDLILEGLKQKILI